MCAGADLIGVSHPIGESLIKLIERDDAVVMHEQVLRVGSRSGDARIFDATLQVQVSRESVFSECRPSEATTNALQRDRALRHRVGEWAARLRELDEPTVERNDGGRSTRQVTFDRPPDLVHRATLPSVGDSPHGAIVDARSRPAARRNPGTAEHAHGEADVESSLPGVTTSARCAAAEGSTCCLGAGGSLDHARLTDPTHPTGADLQIRRSRGDCQSSSHPVANGLDMRRCSRDRHHANGGLPPAAHSRPPIPPTPAGASYPTTPGRGNLLGRAPLASPAARAEKGRSVQSRLATARGLHARRLSARSCAARLQHLPHRCPVRSGRCRAAATAAPPPARRPLPPAPSRSSPAAAPTP